MNNKIQDHVDEKELAPCFEVPVTKRMTGGGYEFTPKPLERTSR